MKYITRIIIAHKSALQAEYLTSSKLGHMYFSTLFEYFEA